MYEFTKDFYGADMAITILGYIRPELDYVSMEALIVDIKFDITVAGNSLAREGWRKRADDGYLWGEEAKEQ